MTRTAGTGRRTLRRRPLAASAAAVAALAAASAPTTLVSANSKCSGSLTCRHGSSCHSGDANYGFLTKYETLPFLETTSVEDEHCKCPEDRTAVDCGTKIVICNIDDGFPCLNNGECHKTHKHKKDVCDCSNAHKDGSSMFAGTHCEFKADNVCDASEDGLETDGWFCTNGGVCRDNESDINKKCNCDDGWDGPHCEFPDDHPTKSKPEETCTLACENGGQCKFGTKSHGHPVEDVSAFFSWGKEVEGMHCVCPKGYAGLQCAVKMEKCGDFHCFHGSKCVTDGDGKNHCDCTTARKEDGTRYAGRFCEHGATSFCDAIDAVEGKAKGSGSLFCTNSGKCNKSEPHKGCECEGTGHTGPLCEYKGGTEPDCTLDCQNGGQCRHGINPDVAGILGTKFDLSLKTHSGFMHCSCPDGFIGPDCSVGFEICGEEEEMQHACANGGKCIKLNSVTANGEPKYSCDCGKSNPFAGQHCEHPATVFCAKSEEGEKGSYHSFCTNGGKCKEEITPAETHPGCDCPDDWEGDHCQYKFGTTPIEEVESILEKEKAKFAEGETSAARNAGGSGGGGGAAVGVAIAITVVAVMALFGVFAHTRMRRMANSNGAAAKDVNLAPKGSYDAEDNRPGSKVSVNLDGQMHDVEII